MFAERVKNVSQSSCRTSVILIYFCNLSDVHTKMTKLKKFKSWKMSRPNRAVYPICVVFRMVKLNQSCSQRDCNRN